jgi:hypothetical protein
LAPQVVLLCGLGFGDEAKEKAHKALNAAETAWYEYAGLEDVGPDRERAFQVYENVRCARRL